MILFKHELVDELGHGPDAAVAEREVHHAGVLAHPVGVVIQAVVENRLVDRAIDVRSDPATRGQAQTPVGVRLSPKITVVEVPSVMSAMLTEEF